MTTPIFCKDCKFRKRPIRRNLYYRATECNHPHNVVIVSQHDWNTEWMVKEWRNAPSELNKGNNCNWYKPKLWTRIQEVFTELGDFIANWEGYR